MRESEREERGETETKVERARRAKVTRAREIREALALANSLLERSARRARLKPKRVNINNINLKPLSPLRTSTVETTTSATSHPRTPLKAPLSNTKSESSGNGPRERAGKTHPLTHTTPRHPKTSMAHIEPASTPRLEKAVSSTKVEVIVEEREETPIDADYTRDQFDQGMAFKDFDGMPHDYGWRSMAGSHLDVEYDMQALARLEASHASASTPFAKELAKLLRQRGKEPIMRSAWRLPSLLELISEDSEQPTGAWVYMTIARGVELIADGVTVQDTHLPNYDSAERDHRDNVDTDVSRQLELRFIDTWSNVSKECGLKGSKPKVILPLGAVMRKGKVRIVFDPSRTLEGSSEGFVRLNDLQIALLSCNIERRHATDTCQVYIGAHLHTQNAH